MKEFYSIAIVTPVHKSGDNQEVSNYRSISILPAAFKVLEKAVAEQLIAHLEFKALTPSAVWFQGKTLH